ncbi:MAG TPA: PBP1A family penicillin-binding protein [Terriglobia bacterium]|nr:PBP1A family penicillin-binding protein [Terriglobia bacterium]
MRKRRKYLLGAAIAIILICGGVFLHYYLRFSHLVDARLNGPIFHHASLIFSAPQPVFPGEAATPKEIEDRLRRALYSEGPKRDYGTGTFQLKGSRLLIYPGPASFFAGEENPEGDAALSFEDGHIASIDDVDHKTSLNQYNLEPEVITTLFDQNRSKRLLVDYQDCPPVLVHAVLAAEDRRFFSHHGVNFMRLVAAAIRDIRADQRLQGGSTLTMQLARNFFLTPKRTFKRKLAEIFLAMLIEQRLSKEEIFTLYANQVYMGQSGSFSIYGFGQAADTYFNKGVKQLTLPEAALLAGIIRGPNIYSPYRYPHRATKRRNWVLSEMQRDGYLTADQATKAKVSLLGVTKRTAGGSEAPYFVDMVKDQLLSHFSEQDLLSESYRVYTTLDPALQAAASKAVHVGMEEVDKRIKARRRKNAPPLAPDQPQTALVVLDPHTGDIRALVGGRNYAESQLDHAFALRQPGSSFKPFVYAAALSSGVDGSQPVITPATVLQDQPTTFEFNGQTYEPKDFKDEYYGTVTVREALALSLNVATVNLAQTIGYEKIRDLAIAAGLDNGIQATPAIALGAYVTTPLQLAGAYTIFANNGVYEQPRSIIAVNDSSGKTLWQPTEASHQVIDPRVSYLMVSLMQTVIDHGTGEGVRARGFTAPAAGKTGTLHDGWFAGFTSNLLAVSWVGYDDNHDLGLTGASSALPLWTEFMKQAALVPAYQKMEGFAPPMGVIVAPIDSQTQVLTANNPLAIGQDVFIDGTQPVSASAASGVAGWLRKILPFGHNKSNTAAPAQPAAPGAVPGSSSSPTGAQPSPSSNPNPAVANSQKNPAPPPPKKSEGILKKIFSIFGHHKAKTDKQDSNQPQQ